MIRVKISNFIKRNKNKLQDLLTKLIMVAIVIFIATIILSMFRGSGTNKEEKKEIDIYNPTETIIQGSNVSDKQYKTDSSIIEKFLEYCNEEKIPEAYSLVSAECKEEIYPTIEDFKSRYYNYIFDEKRDYNIQAWISTKEYTVYKIRYTTNMLSTGVYEQDNIYQDYITLLKGYDREELSIGNFITKQEINEITSTDELVIQVTRKMTYLEYQEYEILVKNQTRNTILLDSLNSTNNIKLINKSGKSNNVYTNKIFIQDITIAPNTGKKFTLRFNKACDSNEEGEYIQFNKVIRNYNIYMQNKEEYNDLFSVRVRV